MSNQTDGDNVVHHSLILSSRPQMEKYVIENLVDEVFKNLDFLKKVTISVLTISKKIHKFTHSRIPMYRENVLSFSFFA